MDDKTHDAKAARDWAAATAVPLPNGEVTALGELLGDAVVAGFAESTRASREIVRLGHELLRYLVEHKGFRTLALAEDASVMAELDGYTRTGHGDVAAILGNAFLPWRITEMVDLVEWIRGYNAGHAEDPVRIIGLSPAAIRDSHYDEVLDHLRAVAPALAEPVGERYAVIRTTHQLPEHVQRSQGVHPGRPFVELAREAYELLTGLPDHPMLETARRIFETHDNSIANGYDFDGLFRATATALADWHAATGHKVLFWEGLAHVAKAKRIGFTKLSDFTETTGHWLREHFGDDYRTVAVGFDHGEIHDGVLVPVPPDDFADSVLGAAEPETYLLDLRAAKPEAVARWLSGDHKLRVIAGVYKPEEDAQHHLSGGPLDEWFDAVLRIRTISPTTML